MCPDNYILLHVTSVTSVHPQKMQLTPKSRLQTKVAQVKESISRINI